MTLFLQHCADKLILLGDSVPELVQTFRTGNELHAQKMLVSASAMASWHLIDCVIVRRTDRHDIRVTNTTCMYYGADCLTYRRLVVSQLNLRIQPVRRHQGKKAPKRLDVFKLNQNSKGQAFLSGISSQLDAINLSSENAEGNWHFFIKRFIL